MRLMGGAMADLRKMTMGEIAEIADIPKETARMRLKGHLGFVANSYGWARFDVPSTVRVAVHAQALRLSGIADVAVQTADFVADSLYNLTARPPHTIMRKGMLEGHSLIFRHAVPGLWKHHWSQSQDQALHDLGRHVADTGYAVEAAGFYFLNLGTLTDWALDRIFDLQGIDGNAATVPQ